MGGVDSAIIRRGWGRFGWDWGGAVVVVAGRGIKFRRGEPMGHNRHTYSQQSAVEFALC